MKTFKNIFIKDDSETGGEKQPAEKPGFPISGPSNVDQGSANPYLDEIIEVYDKGLESINMPGYDFYDFYIAIKAAGIQNESIYKMAFQMGKTMDAGITPEKLVSDAEYYVRKINDVFQSYSEQGKKKLNSLESQLKADKEKFTSDANRIESDISKMKQQIQSLEKTLAETRNSLHKVDSTYKPQQDSIQHKLLANDQAMQISIQKLNTIKESILKFLK